jgi:Amino acid synthesis
MTGRWVNICAVGTTLRENLMLQIRKSLLLRDTLTSEMSRVAERPVVRAVAMAVIGNPFAGRYVEDLTELFEAGRMVGEQLMPELVRMLAQNPVSYGKGAIVGVNGEFEHGGACIHPMLGKPMRAAVGGGKAVIPSNVKVAACGASLDVPLSHKDDPWSFDHFDTVTVSMPDAPRPDEIVVVLAVADGGRLHARCGTAPR